jgi:adenylate kinase family enzyme
MKTGSGAILIGGTSHLGKTTLSKLLADGLDTQPVSTDSLTRHPGRPWQTGSSPVPDKVTHHYQELSTDELVEDVLQHYLW